MGHYYLRENEHQEVLIGVLAPMGIVDRCWGIIPVLKVWDFSRTKILIQMIIGGESVEAYREGR